MGIRKRFQSSKDNLVDIDDLEITLSDNLKQSMDYARLSDIIIAKPSRAQFPNVGDTGHLYLDESTGDLFSYGYAGDYYTSVSVANGDIIYGGDAEPN